MRSARERVGFGRFKPQVWGLAAMSFGATLAARAGVWLFGAFRQPAPRAWPIVLIALVCAIGATVAVWGGRSYNRVHHAD